MTNPVNTIKPKPVKTYLLHNAKDGAQVLIKKSTMEGAFSIDFLSYSGKDKEFNYAMSFSDVYLRDNLFNLIEAPSSYSSDFIESIYVKYLKKS